MDGDHQVLSDDVRAFVDDIHDPSVARSWISFYQARLSPSEPSPASYFGTVSMKTANQSYLQALRQRLAELDPESAVVEQMNDADDGLGQGSRIQDGDDVGGGAAVGPDKVAADDAQEDEEDTVKEEERRAAAEAAAAAIAAATAAATMDGDDPEPGPKRSPADDHQCLFEMDY